MPKHFRVAIATRDLLKDRVTGLLGKAASVGAVGDSLHRGISSSGVNEHQWWFAILAEAAGIVPIHHGAAAEHRAHGIGQKFVAEFLPVNEVFADGVAPVHVSPAPAIRVVLEKEVILAIVEDHAIRVVVPSALGREVELSSQGLTPCSGQSTREILPMRIALHCWEGLSPAIVPSPTIMPDGLKRLLMSVLDEIFDRGAFFEFFNSATESLGNGRIA